MVGTALQLTWIAIDHDSCKIFAKTSTTHKRKWDNGQVVYGEAVLFFFFKYFNSLFILKKQSNAFLFAKSLDTDGDDVDDSGGGGIKISVKNAWRCTAQFVQLDPGYGRLWALDVGVGF